MDTEKLRDAILHVMWEITVLDEEVWNSRFACSPAYYLFQDAMVDLLSPVNRIIRLDIEAS